MSTSTRKDKNTVCISLPKEHIKAIEELSQFLRVPFSLVCTRTLDIGAEALMPERIKQGPLSAHSFLKLDFNVSSLTLLESMEQPFARVFVSAMELGLHLVVEAVKENKADALLRI